MKKNMFIPNYNVIIIRIVNKISFSRNIDSLILTLI